jgi:hypothetical protein
MIIVLTENNKPTDAFYRPEKTNCEHVIKLDKNSLVAKAFLIGRAEPQNETVTGTLQ